MVVTTPCCASRFGVATKVEFWCSRQVAKTTPSCSDQAYVYIYVNL